jgi:hypothetical protein
MDLQKLLLAQGLVTLFALVVAYVKLRQDFRQYARQQLFSVRLERLRRQLSELYGPIHMLTVANARIAKVAWGTDIWDQVWRQILIPTQLKIEDLLLTKIELLDEHPMPDSFLAFLTHARVARSYVEPGLSVGYFEKGIHYPVQFDQDVARTYEMIRTKYTEVLGQVRRDAV